LTYTVYHGLCRSASPVLMATGFVNGKGQFMTPYRIDTPQPITKKVVTGNYVSDLYSCARMFLFWVSLICLPFRVSYLPKPQFWGRE